MTTSDHPHDCDAAPDPELMAIWLACDTGDQTGTQAAVAEFAATFGQEDGDAVDVD